MSSVGDANVNIDPVELFPLKIQFLAASPQFNSTECGNIIAFSSPSYSKHYLKTYAKYTVSCTMKNRMAMIAHI